MTAPVFLLVGSPAAGKSTTARALAARFARSIHVPVDDLRHMVVGGMAWPSPDWSAEVRHQVTLGRAAALAITREYRAAGFTVVLDDFFDPLGLAEYRDLLAGAGVRGVVLHPTQAEARRRNAARHGGSAEPYVEMAITHAYGLLAPELSRLAAEGWLVLDTTELDVEASVDAILAGVPGGERA